MIKKTRKVILWVGTLVLLQSFYVGDSTKVASKNGNDSVVVVVPERKLPETFDELMKDTLYKDLRDSIYIDGKIYVESRGNPVVRSGNQVGILQITPIMVKECNNILKKNGNDKRFVLGDRLDPDKSIEIYRIVMEEHNPYFDLFEASSIWNAGRKSKRLGEETYVKVKSYHNRIIKRMRFLYAELQEGNKSLKDLSYYGLLW